MYKMPSPCRDLSHKLSPHLAATLYFLILWLAQSMCGQMEMWMGCRSLLSSLCIGSSTHFKISVCGVLVSIYLHARDVLLFRWGGLLHLHKAVIGWHSLGSPAQHHDPHYDDCKHCDASNGNGKRSSRHALGVRDGLLADILQGGITIWLQCAM